MKKSKQRFTTLLLVTLLLMVSSVRVFAVNNENGVGTLTRMSYINEANVDITISSGKAYVSAYILGYSNVTKLKAVIYLQKKNGSSWTTVKTWTESESDDSLYFNTSYSISSGTYRVKLKATAYSGSSSETYTVTSASESH